MAKSVSMQLRPAGPAAINGDSATVTCSRGLSFTPKGSKTPIGKTDRVRVTLGRGGPGWVIRSIEQY
jgi:hypothetical protein